MIKKRIFFIEEWNKEYENYVKGVKYRFFFNFGRDDMKIFYFIKLFVL